MILVREGFLEEYHEAPLNMWTNVDSLLFGDPHPFLNRYPAIPSWPMVQKMHRTWRANARQRHCEMALFRAEKEDLGLAFPQKFMGFYRISDRTSLDPDVWILGCHMVPLVVLCWWPLPSTAFHLWDWDSVFSTSSWGHSRIHRWETEVLVPAYQQSNQWGHRGEPKRGRRVDSGRRPLRWV